MFDSWMEQEKANIRSRFGNCPVSLLRGIFFFLTITLRHPV